MDRISVRSGSAACCATLGLLTAMAARADVSPCQVVTEADVRAALGGQWKVWQDMGSGEVCAFQMSPTAIVTVTLFSDPMGAESILESRRQLAADKARSAPGPGAGAYKLTLASANVIAFGKGDTVVQLEVSYAASNDAAVLDRLAKTAYERLP